MKRDNVRKGKAKVETDHSGTSFLCQLSRQTQCSRHALH